MSAFLIQALHQAVEHGIRLGPLRNFPRGDDSEEEPQSIYLSEDGNAQDSDEETSPTHDFESFEKSRKRKHSEETKECKSVIQKQIPTVAAFETLKGHLGPEDCFVTDLFKDEHKKTKYLQFQWESETTSLQLTQSQVNVLVKKSQEAKFGDTQSGDTKYDLRVRNARELVAGTHFTIDDFFTTEIALLWKAYMRYPRYVSAVPHKINIYGEEGHFAVHKDTPASGLVGTFLLSLFYQAKQTEDIKSKVHLLVDNEHEWEAKAGTWCAFYADLPHEVKHVAAQRVVLAFKIFVDNSWPSPSCGLTFDLSQRALTFIQTWRPPFGFVLSHEYSAVEKKSACKGLDSKLHEILLSCQDLFAVHFVPVTVHLSEDRAFDGESESLSRRSCDVHLIDLSGVFVDKLRITNPQVAQEVKSTDALSKYIGHKDKSTSCKKPRISIPFFKLSERTGYRWKREKQSGGFTGNEGHNGSLEAIYLHYALVCVPSK
jgi:hypothetical protein